MNDTFDYAANIVDSFYITSKIEGKV